MNLSGLIHRYLEKLGVSDFTQLQGDERATYDEWQEVLSKEVKIEDVQRFIESQQVNLSNALREAVSKGDDRVALLITARLNNYDDLHGVITAPERNRETLSEHLKSLLQYE